MDSLFFLDSERKISESEINEIESRYNISFSQEYKDLILKYNGGRPNKTLFKGSDDGLILAEVYPLKYGKYTLEDALNKFSIIDKIIPEYLIPIGADPADNLICLSQKANEFGSIYVWMFDSIEELRFVAKTLNQVLSELQEFEW
jgi:SMI1-KNR4 cell-wall